jgi:hypothetical protein
LVLILILGALGYFYSKGYLNLLKPQSQTPTSSDVFNYGDVTPNHNQTPSASSSNATNETGSVNSKDVKLIVAYPANGSTLNSTALTVIGKTSPGAEVFINDQATKADANGNFSLKIALDEGKNGLAVTANDAFGNVAEQDLSVNVQSF